MTVLASSLRHISSMSPSLGAVGEVELDQLARADVVDAGKAEPFERVVDRLALRVEDAGLQGDEHARFHGFRLSLGEGRAPMASLSIRGKFYPSFTAIERILGRLR